MELSDERTKEIYTAPQRKMIEENTRETSQGLASMPSPIQLTLQVLEDRFTSLFEIATALEHRLEPVMREPGVSTLEGNKDGRMPVASQVSRSLQRHVNEAEKLMEQLVSILERLEI